MSRQMPEFYLRGAIFNKVMKNLTPNQMKEVEDKIEALLQIPSLTKSREKFCQTLANTIGADYREDKNAALQEYRLALLKAVLYILFYKPNRQVFDDPIQTRKLVSQITYNYMKQILNENKIPKSINVKNVNGEPYLVAFKEIENILDREGIFHANEHHETENGYVIEGDIGIIGLKTAQKIGKLKRKYTKLGVKITTSMDRIEVIKEWTSPNIETRIRSANRIQVINLEHNTDEENDFNRHNIEYRISTHNQDKPSNFDQNYMRKILPSHLVKLFDIIIDNDNISTKSEIARKLNIPVSEASKKLDQLKYYYYVAKV